MNYPVIKITTPLYTCVYFQGNKFAEGYEITSVKWIQLGMIMMQMGMNMSHIHRVFIGHDDNDNSLIKNNEFPNNINELPDEVKKLIFEVQSNVEPTVEQQPVENKEEEKVNNTDNI